MNAYKTYFDRQTLSPAAHDRLMALGKAPAKKKSFSLQKWGTLAACAALIILGWKGLSYQWQPPLPTENDFPLHGPAVDQPSHPPEPGKTDPVDPLQPPEDNGILIHSPAAEGQTQFYMLPALNFQSRGGDTAADIALPEGSFYVELTMEDLQKILWGPQGKPESTSADLPWVLGWDGYTLWAGVRYDGNGDLWMLSVYGSKGLDTFELEISPGRLPPHCIADPGGESADVNGTEVTSWYHAYDRNGDGLTDHVCTSEFLVDGYGYRFRNAYTETGEEEYDVAEAAKFQNICFVMRTAQWTDSRCYFDHIAHNDNIPPWEETTFDTLEEARTRAEFAPYLPETAPDFGDFYGRHSYQKGNYNYLFVRWNDDRENHLEVEVRLPEGDSNSFFVPVEVGDLENHLKDQFDVTLRAGDLSLDVVKALEKDSDVDGFRFWFYVLHDNGVVVSYIANGMTAEEVWALIEPTI